MRFSSFIFLLLAFVSCSGSNAIEDKKSDSFKISEEFKKYWYNGGAEITSYELTQARYGEIREGGTVVNIFVTEPFDTEKFIKPDKKEQKDIEVLKLNQTKNFLTGIYPYSMMNSSFYPLNGGGGALKITSSSQEWCGHTYMQILRKKKLNVMLHSYFESEGEQDYDIDNCAAEDDLFSQIRINPNDIKIGKIKMLPSLFYLRLKHIDAKAYDAEISKETKGNSTFLIVFYTQLNRKLSIEYDTSFPHIIRSWEETYDDSFDNSGKILTSKAIFKKQIRSKYWEHNHNSDSILRKELGL